MVNPAAIAEGQGTMHESKGIGSTGACEARANQAHMNPAGRWICHAGTHRPRTESAL